MDLDTSLHLSRIMKNTCIANGSSGKRSIPYGFLCHLICIVGQEEQWESINYDTSLNRGEVDKPLRMGLVLGYILGDERVASREMVFSH